VIMLYTYLVSSKNLLQFNFFNASKLRIVCNESNYIQQIDWQVKFIFNDTVLLGATHPQNVSSWVHQTHYTH